MALLLLAGCGGNSNNDIGTASPPSTPTAPATTVPTSIGSSVGAFIAYLQTLTGSTSESSEPLVVSSAVIAPTDDTAEPTKVN